MWSGIRDGPLIALSTVVDVVQESDMVDKFGNTIELTKAKKYTKKELKQKKQRRMKRFKETGDDFDSDEEDF